jgi:PAS domain S-box-containing protein
LRAKLWPLVCEESLAEAAFIDRFLAQLGAGLGAAEALLFSNGFRCEHRWQAAGRQASAATPSALEGEAHQHLTSADRAFTWKSEALSGEAVGCAYRVLGQVGGALGLARLQPWDGEQVAFVQEAADLVARALTRRKVDAGLRQSELRYRIVSELSSQYAFSATVQPDGRSTLDWFSGIRHMDAQSLGDLSTLAARLGELSPEGRVVSNQVLKQCLKTNAPAGGRFPVRQRGVADRWLRIDMRPVWNAVEKRVSRVFAAVRDETELVAGQHELERERDLWRDLVQAAPVGIAAVSLDGVLLDCNQAACELLGARDRSELVGLPITEMAPLDDAERSKPLLAQVRAGRPLTGLRWTGRALDGLEIPVDVFMGLVRDRDGRPASFTCLVVPARPGGPGEAVNSELGDLLSAILGNAGLALAALDRDSPARQDLLQVLAAAERTAALLRGPTPRQPTPRPRRRVALIDAEELMRRAAGTILERDGFEVLPFATTGDALQALSSVIGGLSAVVLDVRQPEADAATALSRLRALRPDLPVLLTTALAHPAVEANVPGAILLPKPYSREQLLAALARAMAASDA